jgi:hypothetical protein
MQFRNPGWKKFGFGIREKEKIRIRDKHPGSVTQDCTRVCKQLSHLKAVPGTQLIGPDLLQTDSSLLVRIRIPGIPLKCSNY